VATLELKQLTCTLFEPHQEVLCYDVLPWRSPLWRCDVLRHAIFWQVEASIQEALAGLAQGVASLEQQLSEAGTSEAQLNARLEKWTGRPPTWQCLSSMVACAQWLCMLCVRMTRGACCAAQTEQPSIPWHAVLAANEIRATLGFASSAVASANIKQFDGVVSAAVPTYL
jgi:hypothetical protein